MKRVIAKNSPLHWETFRLSPTSHAYRYPNPFYVLHSEKTPSKRIAKGAPILSRREGTQICILFPSSLSSTQILAPSTCWAWSQSALGAAGVLGQEPNQLAHDEQRARTRRTEKERSRKSMKSDSNLHGSLPNFAQRFAMKIKSYF